MAKFFRNTRSKEELEEAASVNRKIRNVSLGAGALSFGAGTAAAFSGHDEFPAILGLVGSLVGGLGGSIHHKVSRTLQHQADEMYRRETKTGKPHGFKLIGVPGRRIKQQAT